MPKYTVVISKTARKQLDKFSDHIAKPILHTIASLADNPHPHGCKKLKGRNGYRIIYDIIDHLLVVDVIAIGDRKDIYD